MAGHLLSAGWAVVGYDVDDERRGELARAGGTPADTATGVASACDLIVTSLPSSAAAQAVCSELAAASRPGLVVVESSTLPTPVKEQCRQDLAAAAAVLLDCPMIGTGAQALERDVVVLGSGDEAAFERARPMLEVIAKRVRYLGPFGRGTTMKFVANLLVAVHNVATAEAFALGTRAGLEPQQIWETVREGAGGSVIFDKRGRLMVDHDYLPATAKMSMFVKDTDLIADLAAQLDLPTPMLTATRSLYAQAMSAGLAESDAAALLEVMGAAHLSSTTHEPNTTGGP
jgi:putative dehydrogenase